MKIYFFIAIFIVFIFILVNYWKKKPKMFENLITSEEGKYILQKCRFTRDFSYDLGKTSTCILSKKDTAIEKILGKIAEKIGKRQENMEDIEVVLYETEGIHPLHYDSRHSTLTLFLNDDFEGGDIFFPCWGETFKPAKNGGLLFQTKNNLFSYHQNISVKRGKKYVVYIWIHE
jgi:hypothetical protein